MKIYTRVVFNMETGEEKSRKWYEYTGPISWLREGMSAGGDEDTEGGSGASGEGLGEGDGGDDFATEAAVAVTLLTPENIAILLGVLLGVSELLAKTSLKSNSVLHRGNGAIIMF